VGVALDLAESQKASEELREAERQTTGILHALRIFKFGNLMLPGSVRFGEQSLIGILRSWTASSAPNAKSLFSKDYRFTTTEGNDFAVFWKDLQEARKKRFVENAIRRFGYASDRDLPDDKLVDLMIAAESLFLSDTGESKQRGELRYRLAERFAFFVCEVPGCPRRTVFRHIRNAYDVRSSIVHGDAVSEDSLKTLEGKVPIEKFVDLTEQLLRAALKKMIDAQKQSGGVPLDWNRLIFG
jgi:hypothetical protein